MKSHVTQEYGDFIQAEKFCSAWRYLQAEQSSVTWSQIANPARKGIPNWGRVVCTAAQPGFSQDCPVGKANAPFNKTISSLVNLPDLVLEMQFFEASSMFLDCSVNFRMKSRVVFAKPRVRKACLSNNFINQHRMVDAR